MKIGNALLLSKELKYLKLCFVNIFFLSSKNKIYLQFNLERWITLMRKIIIIFFIFLLFNITITASADQPRILRQGFYTTKDLNLSPDALHTIQNTSPTEYVSVVLFDSNEIVQEFIRLVPKSEKYTLPPIQIGYEIIIIGDGEVTIS